MSETYEFVLIFSLPAATADTDELIERLGQAGCADALVGVGKPGEVALDFCREAHSFDAAISSAVADVKRAIPGAILTQTDTHTDAPRPLQTSERYSMRA